MKRDENCIFCKIISNEVPSYKVYEDPEFFGFLTIKPLTKGHMLLVPKNHSEDILVMDSDEYLHMMMIAKTMAEKIKGLFNPARVSMMVVGLEVAHTHLHIFPTDKIENINPQSAYDATKEELSEVQNLYLN